MAADSSPTEALIDIAVLDDDLDFRNYMEDVLKDEGSYTVRTFAHPDDLFAAAEQQRDSSRRTMDDYSAPQNEKRAAQSRHAQAIDQLEPILYTASANMIKQQLKVIVPEYSPHFE